MKSILNDRFWQLTGLFFILKLCLHLFTFNTYELHRDEMLFFNQGAHPSLGNISVPPFIGWLAFLIQAVWGYSILGIRLIPMVLGAMSVIILARIVKDLGGGVPALFLSCTAFILAPGFLLFHSLFTVNVLDQFFWLLLTFRFFNMVNSANPKLWMGIGILGGFAFLNKYLVTYLFAGFFIALLFTPQRTVLFSKYFAYALIIGFMIIFPNIYWQYSHGWPLSHHISELSKSQMVHMTYLNYLMDLYSLNYVSTFFWLAGCLAGLLIRDEKKYRYLGILALSVILLSMLSRGKAYYVLGIFPVLFALSGYMLEKYLTKQLKWINYLVLGFIILLSGLALPLSLPVLSFEQLANYSKKTAACVSYPFSRWEDGEVRPVSQVFSDMTGWKEMVALVNRAYVQIPENERARATIYAERNYGYAGAVHFYGKRYNLPEAITFLESYVLWAPDTIAQGPMIYINHEIAGLDKFFEQCSEIGAVNDPYFREKGLKVFLCVNPKDTMREVYKQKAKTEKAIFH